MPDPRRTLRKASPRELDALSRYSESDKQRAREAAKLDGGPRLRAMLDAEVLSRDTTSTGRKHRKTLR
jgi:hypothetical protein